MPVIHARTYPKSYMATFHIGPTESDGFHCSREKGLPTPPSARPSGSSVARQFLSLIQPMKQWGKADHPPPFPLHKLSRPHKYRYVTNPEDTCSTEAKTARSLTDRTGLQPWRLGLLFTSYGGPPGLNFYPSYIILHGVIK